MDLQRKAVTQAALLFLKTNEHTATRHRLRALHLPGELQGEKVHFFHIQVSPGDVTVPFSSASHLGAVRTKRCASVCRLRGLDACSGLHGVLCSVEPPVPRSVPSLSAAPGQRRARD